MARGSKSKYTRKQKRTAEKIEEGYLKRGTPRRRAERVAWATVNKMYGGGARGGSGSRRIVNKAPAKRGGRIGGPRGGRKAARRPKAARVAAARKAARTRRRRYSTKRKHVARRMMRTA